MTDTTSESELRQRGGNDEKTEEEEKVEVKEEQIATTTQKKQEIVGTWQTIKYYFNRFRYYHYVVAETVDKYLSAAGLFIIKWYFKLFMGVGAPSSTLTEAEE